MKHNSILIIFMFIPFVLNAAHIEEKQVDKAAHQAPDWQPFYAILQADYKNYLQKQLEVYKKESLELSKLAAIGWIVLKDHVGYNLIHDVVDGEGNRFIHIATERNNVKGVEWLHGYHTDCFNYKNLNQQYPIDLCIKQLMLSASGIASIVDSIREVFDTTLNHISQQDCYSEIKEHILSKIFALQLVNKKHCKVFTVDQKIIESLVPIKNAAAKSSYLSLLRQQTSDETDGSTFTHVAVEQQNSDDLFELAQSKSISFAKNKLGVTAMDIAMHRLRKFTLSMFTLDTVETAYKSVENCFYKNALCCFYILMNYSVLKSKLLSVPVPFGSCCPKHALIVK